MIKGVFIFKDRSDREQQNPRVQFVLKPPKRFESTDENLRHLQAVYLYLLFPPSFRLFRLVCLQLIDFNVVGAKLGRTVWKHL